MILSLLLVVHPAVLNTPSYDIDHHAYGTCVYVYLKVQIKQITFNKIYSVMHLIVICDCTVHVPVSNLVGCKFQYFCPFCFLFVGSNIRMLTHAAILLIHHALLNPPPPSTLLISVSTHVIICSFSTHTLTALSHIPIIPPSAYFFR